MGYCVFVTAKLYRQKCLNLTIFQTYYDKYAKQVVFWGVGGLIKRFVMLRGGEQGSRNVSGAASTRASIDNE